MTKIKLPIDTSKIPKSVTCLTGKTYLDISKDELFMLGIFKHEVPPEHVGDNEYLYLASKIPAYVQLYEDFIETKNGSIVNKSSDDRLMKDISEIVGIAVGIKYTIDSFEIRHEEISKIPTPKEKTKYLDYKFTLNGRLYELETKGTTSKNINKFVTDIVKKKKNSNAAYLRYGTVAVLTKPDSSHTSKLHICDDPPKDNNRPLPGENMPWHYIYALGHLLDNKYYNKYQKLISDNKRTDQKISNSFFGIYEFNNQTYAGEFFDYRLNLENITEILTGKENSVHQIFRKVTKAQGRTKIFIGIDSRIISIIDNGGYLPDILSLNLTGEIIKGKQGQRILLGSDGIIIVLCQEKIDPQVEEQFTEKEVKRRLGHLFSLIQGEPEVCGMPCRSREKEGKSCEIKTYRGACHFHR